LGFVSILIRCVFRFLNLRSYPHSIQIVTSKPASQDGVGDVLNSHDHEGVADTDKPL